MQKLLAGCSWTDLCLAILISQIDDQVARTKEYVKSQVPALEDGTWDLEWHIHGRDTESMPRSLFLIGESRGKTQELATSIVAAARVASIHGNYPGQKATSGNFAFGIGATTEIRLGPCSEFCIYHLMDLEPGEERSLFRIGTERFNNGPLESGTREESNALSAAKTPKTKQEPESDALPAKTNPSNSRVLHSFRTLFDVANVLRSKNAGPYEITFDILFDRKDFFEAIKASSILTRDRIASLYGLTPDQIIWSGFFDQALAFKATIPRMRRGMSCAGGGFMEDDIHGSQMYIPLSKLELPSELQEQLLALG